MLKTGTQNIDALLKRVVIIEDNAELRNVYRLILKSVAEYRVVNAYEDAESAIRMLKHDTPDLILMDLNLPGMSGTTATIRIKKVYPEVKILVVTVHDDTQHVFEALCAGAIGYITKDAGHHELLNAVSQVLVGGAPMSARIANLVIKSFHTNPHTPLTERETAVLRQLAQGKTYEYIGRFLNMSKDTVKTHIRHIYEKLQVDNKSDAVIKARNDNLV